MWRQDFAGPVAAGVPQIIWNFGPDENDKFWTLKRIRGQLAFQLLDAGNTEYELSWWVVRGQTDGGGAIISRMDTSDDAALAEDSYLEYKAVWGAVTAATTEFIPDDDFSHPWWTNVDIKVNRRLQYPERIICYCQTFGADDTFYMSRCRALVARP